MSLGVDLQAVRGNLSYCIYRPEDPRNLTDEDRQRIHDFARVPTLFKPAHEIREVDPGHCPVVVSNLDGGTPTRVKVRIMIEGHELGK